jgi:hypothetical protein
MGRNTGDFLKAAMFRAYLTHSDSLPFSTRKLPDEPKEADKIEDSFARADMERDK